MNGRTRAVILLVAVVLFAIVSCKREANRETVTTDTGVAPTQAGATDTSYVGGGGNVTTTGGPTSTDTAGTSGGTAMTAGGGSTSSAGTADVGGGSKKADAAMKKATTEPGKAGST